MIYPYLIQSCCKALDYIQSKFVLRASSTLKSVTRIRALLCFNIFHSTLNKKIGQLCQPYNFQSRSQKDVQYHSLRLQSWWVYEMSLQWEIHSSRSSSAKETWSRLNRPGFYWADSIGMCHFLQVRDGLVIGAADGIAYLNKSESRPGQWPNNVESIITTAPSERNDLIWEREGCCENNFICWIIGGIESMYARAHHVLWEIFHFHSKHGKIKFHYLCSILWVHDLDTASWKVIVESIKSYHAIVGIHIILSISNPFEF